MSFSKLVNEVFQKKIEVSNVKSIAFKSLFTSDENFRKFFYDFFSISGASLVIADALDKKVVLLQEEIEEAKDLPVLDIPVYLREDHRGIFIDAKSLNQKQFNYLSNRLFQIQRQDQGMVDHVDEVTFKNVPEFLELLPSMNDSSETKSISHKLIPDYKLLYGFILWRFLIWIQHKEKVSDIDFLELSKEDLIFTNYKESYRRNYFSQPNINKKFAPRNLPEYSIHLMKIISNWHGNEECYKVWNQLTKKVDRIKSEFQSELDILNQICDKNVIDRLKKYINSKESTTSLTPHLFFEILDHFLNDVGYISGTKISELLEQLHEKIPLIISYYYFSLIDEKIKSHFVFSIWHSPFHPIEYYDKNNKLTKHSSVFNCVVSINGVINAQKQVQLVTSIKLLTESVVNTVLIERLLRAEQQKDKFQFQRNILLSSSNSKKGVFLLGAFEERITFIAQQSRALNLIRSLCEFGILTTKSRIAIIGGGISGVTASLASHIVGAKEIYVFERANNILTFQSNASHRYIHPYIYDWPSTIYDKQKTELPFLNWSAGYANEVLKEIKTSFEEIINTNDIQNISIVKNAEVISLENGQNYRIKTSEPKVYSNFDLVIIAAGQGEEVNKYEVEDHKTYWEKDDLEENLPEDTEVLIAGCGDGALVDIIRAKLSLNHKSIFLLTNNDSIRKLGHRMLHLDREYLKISYLKEEELSLFDFYLDHFDITSTEISKALVFIRGYYKENIHITHLYRSNILKVQTSLLNRLLVLLLHIDCKVSSVYHQQKLVISCNKNIDESYTVTYASGDTRTFDRVFFRYGTNIRNHLNALQLGDFNNSRQTFKLNITNHVSHDTSEWYKDLMLKERITYD